MDQEKKPKYTLLTNISFIQPNKTPFVIRSWAHAILITQDGAGLLGPSSTVRGFGVQPWDEKFSIFLPEGALPFKVNAEVHDPNVVFISDVQREPKPLFSGTLLEFNDGNSIYLDSEDRHHPLDIEEFDEIEKVWAVLPRKVEKYWQTPYIPHIGQRPRPPRSAEHGR